MKPISTNGSVECSVELKGPSVARHKWASGSSRGPILGAITMDRCALDLGLSIQDGAMELSLRPQDPQKRWGSGIITTMPSATDALLRIERHPDIRNPRTTVRMEDVYSGSTARHMIIETRFIYNVIEPTSGTVLRSISREKQTRIYTTTTQDPKKFRALIRRVNKKMGLQIPLSLDPLKGTWSSV